MTYKKLAIKNCVGVNGFVLSEYGSDEDFTFKQGEQVRQINVDNNQYDLVISLTHWSRPGSFHAADRVRITLRNRELYEQIIKDIAKNFDKIISEFRFYRNEEDRSSLSGDIKAEKYLELCNTSP